MKLLKALDLNPVLPKTEEFLSSKQMVGLSITEYSMYLIEITTRIHSFCEPSKNVDSLLINCFDGIQRTRSLKLCILFHMSAKSNFWIYLLEAKKK